LNGDSAKPETFPLLDPKALLAAACVALPPILFYAILFRNAINVPFQDDYEALLDFLNQISVAGTVPAKTSYLLAAQFNEYKLFFGHSLAWLQLITLGHIDIRVLCALGNLFVALLAILLWKMFLPNHADLTQRIAFFVPVSWLLFQLQYVETLDWAMPSLAAFPVLVFSFASIYLLARPSSWSFCGALTCLVLAVASFANGFVLVPLGLMILGLEARYARMAVWIVFSAGCAAAYAYHYSRMISNPHTHHAVSILSRLSYVIAFMGSAAALPFANLNHRLVVTLSLFLGLLICAFVFVIGRRGYFQRSPSISYCVLFLVFTSVGVAGLRSELGIAHSLDSRYRIYSVLLLIFVWFAFVEESLQYETVKVRRNIVLVLATTFSVLFSLAMDAWGRSYLSERNLNIVAGMRSYEHSNSTGFTLGPIIPSPGQDPRIDELDRRAPLILKQSIKLGIYKPPAY
jgi:hypothetical protein